MSEEIAVVLLWALYWLTVATLAALLCLAVGGFFLRRRKLGQTARLAVALFLVACAGSALAAGRHAMGSSQFALAYWALIPILFLLFFYLFSDGRFVPRGTRWLPVLFGLSLIGQLFGPSTTSRPSNNPSVPHLPQTIFSAILLLGDALAVVVLTIGVVPQVYARRRHLAKLAPFEPVPWRMLSAAAGMGVVLVVVSAAVFTQPFGTQMGFPLIAHTIIYLLTTLLPVPLAFSVLNVRPYDRQTLVSRAVYYAALACCLIAVYTVTCALVLVLAFPLRESGGPQLAILSAALVTAALFRPLRTWLQPGVERYLLPDTLRARGILAEVGSDLPSEFHLDALCDQLLLAIQRALDPEAVVLWVRTAPSLSTQAVARLLPAAGLAAVQGTAPAGTPTIELQPRRSGSNGGYALAAGALLVAADDPIHAAMPAGARALSVPRMPADSPTTHVLKAAGAQLALCLLSEDDLLGVLALGPKADARSYSFDECELLDSLALSVAPALRTALLVHEQDTQARVRERTEQELRTARRIQQTLLPKEIPALNGWQIDVYYEPAREVGGDFYDFLPFADGRLGIVLGDVTDKGVPAALVMATTRSMLRAVAQESTPPGFALARVNELLYADLPASMFVTCFYGILDPASGRMCFANAGQDLPYLRGADALVREVRATGMPLGLMPGMAYEENEVVLAGGDGILFYSDGLVEAHDARRAMFGFPRLAALLARDMPAEGPITELLHELAAFTGADWEQEDDITMVALRRTMRQEG